MDDAIMLVKDKCNQMTLSWEEILEIADKNGWDWFGENHEQCSDYAITDKGVGIYACRRTGEFGEERELHHQEHYSFADLFTNRSFLEAIIVMCNLENGPFTSKMDFLQSKLIEDLTNNNGNRAREIITEFLGKE